MRINKRWKTQRIFFLSFFRFGFFFVYSFFFCLIEWLLIVGISFLGCTSGSIAVNQLNLIWNYFFSRFAKLHCLQIESHRACRRQWLLSDSAADSCIFQRWQNRKIPCYSICGNVHAAMRALNQSEKKRICTRFSSRGDYKETIKNEEKKKKSFWSRNGSICVSEITAFAQILELSFVSQRKKTTHLIYCHLIYTDFSNIIQSGFRTTS